MGNLYDYRPLCQGEVDVFAYVVWRAMAVKTGWPSSQAGLAALALRGPRTGSGHARHGLDGMAMRRTCLCPAALPSHTIVVRLAHWKPPCSMLPSHKLSLHISFLHSPMPSNAQPRGKEFGKYTHQTHVSYLRSIRRAPIALNGSISIMDSKDPPTWALTRVPEPSLEGPAVPAVHPSPSSTLSHLHHT